MDTKEHIIALRQLLDKSERELTELEEQELMKRGCHRCGGEIGIGNSRREVQLIGPCSVGSVMQTFIICYDCSMKIHEFLNGKSLACPTVED